MAKSVNTVPVSYSYENLYNSRVSPSTVHVKNSRLRNFFRRYLFQKALSVFKWELPEEWDKDYFLYTLYGLGFLAIFDTDRYGVIPQQCSPGGYNVFYRPTYVIVTNPVFRKTYTLNIDDDCVLLRLMPDYGNINDLVGYYADQMALAAEAMGVNLLNVKSGTVFGAASDAKAQTFYKMYDRLSEGNPAVAIGKDLLDAEGKPTWFPFTANIKEQYVTTDILSDLRKIESMFDTVIGIPSANTDKRERLITPEVNANNAETACLGEIWLETLRKEMNKANEMFNLPWRLIGAWIHLKQNDRNRKKV